MSELLVIGVGHPDRGDDAVGPAVVRALGGGLPAGVRAIEPRGDLLALLDVWAGARAAIVVDAMWGGGAPGRIARISPLGRALAMPAFVSSHAIDLASVIELARGLGRLPRQLVLYGIEGRQFAAGAPPCAEVAAAIPRAAAQIRDELARLARGAR